jgi:hypothetical protein
MSTLASGSIEGALEGAGEVLQQTFRDLLPIDDAGGDGVHGLEDSRLEDPRRTHQRHALAIENEASLEHRTPNGSFLAREPNLFLEEAEGGEANSMVALAHDLSGRILPARQVLAMGWRSDCCQIAAAPRTPDSWPACLNLSQLCLSGPTRWQWPDCLDGGESLTRVILLAPLPTKSSCPSTWGQERRGPSAGDTAEIVELAGFVLAGRQGFGLGAARRQPNRGLTIERAAEQP